jgi:hypothetical protein
MMSHPIDESEAGHARHPQIRHRDIRYVGHNPGDCVLGRPRGGDARPDCLEDLADQRERVRLVIHREHMNP